MKLSPLAPRRPRSRFSKRKKKNLPVIAVIQKKVKSLSSPLQKTRATIDYKNVSLLRKCITGEGKIFPRRLTRVTAKQQRYIENAIKKARILGLLPFINISRPSRL
jgi:small subunit ribosomal protein S18